MCYSLVSICARLALQFAAAGSAAALCLRNSGTKLLVGNAKLNVASFEFSFA